MDERNLLYKNTDLTNNHYDNIIQFDNYDSSVSDDSN